MNKENLLCLYTAYLLWQQAADCETAQIAELLVFLLPNAAADEANEDKKADETEGKTSVIEERTKKEKKPW